MAFWLAGARCVRAQQNAFSPGDHERIVFVGNDFFDHEQGQCRIETAITARFPNKDLIFRNFGYSGDTVLADARSLCAQWGDFGPPDQGFNRLHQWMKQIHPTIVFVAYGMNESFAGPAGIPQFQNNLSRMLNMLCEDHPRLVLISPTAHQPMPAPMPSPAEHNQSLEQYAHVLASAAHQRGALYIDLLHGLNLPTTDGIHLTSEGYASVADAMITRLGFPDEPEQINLSALGRVISSDNASITELQAAPDGLRFVLTPSYLSAKPPILRVSDLPAGTYDLQADGASIAKASAQQLAAGISINGAPSIQAWLALRSKIVEKNFDFYNDWRSQNDTYIVGFRRHEQGRNARELEKFNELAEQADAQIAQLRVPKSNTFVLKRLP